MISGQRQLPKQEVVEEASGKIWAEDRTKRIEDEVVGLERYMS
jgi:hypothetical protein